MTDSGPIAVPQGSYEEANGCPVAFFAKARRDTPVVELTSSVKNQCGYAISRYRDVMAVAKDGLLFTSGDNPQAERWGDYNEEVAAIYREKGWPLVRTLVWADAPDHARFRKLVDRIFTPARVTARQEHIRICIDKLIAKFEDGGVIDGVADFAALLPAMVMTREFGAPEEDFMVLMNATNAIAHAVDLTKDDPADADRLVADAARAITSFQQYMAPRIEAARANPDNTMLSELANAREGEELALSTGELLSILVIFLIAATHSTTGMIGWAMHALTEHPDVQERLRREPQRIPAFIEEVLRVRGVVSASFRTAKYDAEVEGMPIPAGSQVFLRWDSANFDEEKWPEPTEFDIDRKGLAGHLTFGVGPHFCVGNTLARRELVMSITSLLERFARIEAAGEPTEQASFSISVIVKLPLSLAR